MFLDLPIAWGAVSDYVSYQNTTNLKFVVLEYDWGANIYIFDKEEVFIGICNQRDNIIETSGEEKMTVEFSFLAVNRDFYVDFRKETIENITTKIIITLKNDITIQSKLTIPEISGLKLIIAKGKILTVKKPSTDS